MYRLRSSPTPSQKTNSQLTWWHSQTRSQIKELMWTKQMSMVMNTTTRKKMVKKQMFNSNSHSRWKSSKKFQSLKSLVPVDNKTLMTNSANLKKPSPWNQLAMRSVARKRFKWSRLRKMSAIDSSSCLMHSLYSVGTRTAVRDSLVNH